MKHELSLGYLMLPGVPPPELIRIAAAAGCTGVSVSAALTTMMTGQPSLLDDRALRDDTARAFREHDVRFDLVEGVSVSADTDLERARAAIEVMHELGANRFNLSVWVPERNQAEDMIAAYLQIADDLDMRVTVEFMRLSQIRSIGEAAALIRDRFPKLQILVDTLHLARAGDTPADLAAVEPSMVGFCQLNDAPAAYPGDDAYWYEAMNDRMIPGEGELPLPAVLRALPQDVIVALEVPMLARAEAGVSALERARLAADGARRVMATADAAP
jgi:sugar phosphate isomerase/epimerase